MKFAKAFALSFAMLSLVACKKNYVANPIYSDMTMENAKEIDFAYCNALARGNSIPQLQSIPPKGYYAVTNGVLTDQYGHQSTYSQNTYVDNSQAVATAAAANIGTAMGYAIGVSSRRNACMKALGWKTEDEITTQDKEIIAINTRGDKVMSEISPDPLFNDTIRYMHDYLKTLPFIDAMSQRNEWLANPEKFKEDYLKFRSKLAADNAAKFNGSPLSRSSETPSQ